MLAIVLNKPIRAQQFFRTVFYGPSVTSSVVISSIFLWLYLKTGIVNYVFDQIVQPLRCTMDTDRMAQ